MTSKVGSTRGLLILLVCIDLFKSSASYSVSDANNLLVKLFDESAEYNKLVQPATFVEVKAQYKLESVNSLDIKKQVLSTTGFFTLEWKDDRLKWDNASYGFIQHIFVPEDRVWLPDLVVLNSVQELQKNLGAERPVQIKYDGTLVWKPIAVLSTFCVTYFFFFPFDRHNCSLELTCFDYQFSATYLSFLEHPIILDRKPRVQADWEIVNSYAYTTFSKLTFVLELKRLPGHYIMIVIFPTILTAILTYVAFFLPLKSGVRIGYIVTVVLAYVVLLTFFADTMPSSTKYPSVLVVSFTITLGMAFFLIIITIFVTRLYNKPKRSMAPKWMHSLVRKFRKLKLKLKCRGRRIHHLEKNLTIEDGGPTKKVDNEKKSSLLKPYSNKELAEFFDYMLFIVFTVLYILVLAGIPIAAAVWYKKEMDYYYGQ